MIKCEIFGNTYVLSEDGDKYRWVTWEVNNNETRLQSQSNGEFSNASQAINHLKQIEKEIKINALEAFFNRQYKWAEDYYNNHDDYIDGFDHILYDTIDYERFRSINNNSMSDDEIKQYLKDYGKIERASQNYPRNAVTFINIYEIEVQISGIYDDVLRTDDYYKSITSNLSQEEINGVFHKSIASDYCTLNGDCLYYVPDFSSIQLIVNEDHLNNYLNKRSA